MYTPPKTNIWNFQKSWALEQGGLLLLKSGHFWYLYLLDLWGCGPPIWLPGSRGPWCERPEDRGAFNPCRNHMAVGVGLGASQLQQLHWHPWNLTNRYQKNGPNITAMKNSGCLGYIWNCTTFSLDGKHVNIIHNTVDGQNPANHQGWWVSHYL